MEKPNRKRTWRAKGKEPGREAAFCLDKRSLPTRKYSGRALSVGELGSFKCFGLIADFIHPQAIDDAHPDVCQSSKGHAVRLALCAFALVVRSGPGFLQRRLPSKLVQAIAQELQAGEAFVSFGVLATLKGNWSSSGQGLDGIGISVAPSIISPFGQQSRSQAFGSTGQRTPDRLVRMGQKNAEWQTSYE